MKQPLYNLTIWLFAPIMNSRRDALSLGRILMFVYTLAITYTLVWHLPKLIAVPANPVMVASLVFLLVVVFLVLAVYCFGDKPWVRETVLLLASKTSPANPGDFSEVSRFAAKENPSPSGISETVESAPGI